MKKFREVESIYMFEKIEWVKDMWVWVLVRRKNGMEGKARKECWWITDTILTEAMLNITSLINPKSQFWYISIINKH